MNNFVHIALLAINMKGGGAERIAVSVANGFAERGIRTDMLLFQGTGPFLSFLAPQVNRIALNMKTSPWCQLTPHSPLRAYLEEQKPDLVMSFGQKMNRALLAAKLCSGYAGAIVISERNRFSEMYPNPVARALRRWQNRFFYRHADHCICISQGVQDDFVRHGILQPEKTSVIYNPIEVRNTDAVPDHRWLSGKAGPLILGAGTLNTRKNFEMLVEAFALLRKKRGDIRLVILGEGSHRIDLEKRIDALGLAEVVSLPGFVPNPAPYMSKADLFVMPSRHEGFGNVLVEALACGCNVVSTDCPSGPREILENGLYGWLTPTDDPIRMAAAMEDALNNPKPAEFLRSRAEYFSPRRGLEAYIALIEKVLQRARP